MIKINKNSVNRIVLTLNEKSTLYNPITGGSVFWLFKFTKDETKEEVYFNPIYVSANTLYNVFNIVEDVEANINLTGGTLNLTPGFYSYEIFDQTQQYNLNISGTTSCVESGKALCLFPAAEINSYTGTTNTNIVYYQ